MILYKISKSSVVSCTGDSYDPLLKMCQNIIAIYFF